MVEFEARILGGLPVVVRVRFEAPDRDVGFYGGVEIEDIFWRGGRGYRRVSPKVLSRMTPRDWEALEETAWDAKD